MKTLQTGEKLYEALKILVELTKFAQNNFTNQSHLSLRQWAKEFCTINLRVPRRSGHDYCIAQFLKDNPDLCPVIFCASQNMIEIMKNEILKNRVNNKIIFCHPNGDWSNLRGIEIDCIICNCFSLFPANKIDKIYDFGSLHIESNPNFLYIFVG